MIQGIVHRLPERSSRNVDEMHRADFTVGRHTITAEILDASGYVSVEYARKSQQAWHIFFSLQNNFPAMQEVAIRQADCFVLVFAVDSEESLETVKELRQEAVRVKQQLQHCPSVPMVVVANKIDLEAAQRKVDLDYVEFLVSATGEPSFLLVQKHVCDCRSSATGRIADWRKATPRTATAFTTAFEVRRVLMQLTFQCSDCQVNN